VVLIDNCQLPSALHRELVMRKSVKAFTDAMLDLIVTTPTTEEGVVDFLGKQELVYLGPDEQVIPEDINWIVGRAAQRGYPIPSAFMSSKPDAGINHKVYGVTSEGVQVFLDVALREMGMHPEQHVAGDGKEPYFTVKMTGGPDGDVAGNMILILQREYGDKCRIVALADASGCAEDPNGLHPEELHRLVKQSLPIGEFNAAKLSEGGKLYLCDPKKNKTASQAEAALHARNTMHNRVIADAFIPAGGRPATINDSNWKNFLQADGTPSAKLIVEGANLFLTPGAREAMHKATGIPIVKDSSANKCGVICSSFEIMSSMLLSEAEFTSVKKELVGDVLVRLRLLAKREAELLFREFRTMPGSLPDFSQRISLAINRVTDAIAEELDNETGGDYDSMLYLVKGHMPEKLTELAGGRLNERVPKEYLKRAIASTLASQIVYKEGVMFVEQHRDDHLGPLAFDYLKAEAAVAKVLTALDASWGADGAASEEAKIAREIVADGGVRAYMGRHGGFMK
jgi:glutamate dehydrogenase